MSQWWAQPKLVGDLLLCMASDERIILWPYIWLMMISFSASTVIVFGTLCRGRNAGKYDVYF